jgi:hypothetical protein
MPSSRLSPEVARLERAIESKQRLLDYLRSGPKHLTMESFVCLTGILRNAGWSHDGEWWRKKEQRLAFLEAAQMEVAAQIAASKEKILGQTVRNYRS